MEYVFDIKPVPKPRMTRADKWKKRPIVLHYWAYKAELRLKANTKGLKNLSGKLDLHFSIPIPESWSNKKRIEFNGKPHQPLDGTDIDNLVKGVLDTFEYNDSFVYDVHATKHWGIYPLITITTYDE